MTDITYESGDTLSAFFDTRSEADAAVERLRSAGISQDKIRVEGRDIETGEPTDGDPADGDANRSGERGLGDYYISDEDRHAYSEGIRRGGYVVFVTGADRAHRDTVFDIFETSGAVDFDERERSWRDEGWTGYTGTSGGGVTSGTATHGAGYGSGATSASAASGFGSTGAPSDAERESAGFAESRGEFAGRDSDESVPVIEEQLRVGKRDSSHGRVRVRSYVREEPVSEDVALRDEHVEVERRPVDRPVSGSDAFRDRTIEAEEHSEEAVVSKDARVVEEVGLRKEGGVRHETVTDTVRHTDVEVERDDDTANRRR